LEGLSGGCLYEWFLRLVTSRIKGSILTWRFLYCKFTILPTSWHFSL
jgi:hypothetical protein